MTAKLRRSLLARKRIRVRVAFLGGLSIVMNVLIQQAAAQTAADTTVHPQVDRAGLEHQGGPVTTKGTTGALASRCGSYVQGAELVSESYALADGSKGGASIEVVSFPKGYRYAAHDLFGSILLTAAYDERVSGAGDLRLALDKVRCMTWQFEDGTKGGTLCYAQVADSNQRRGLIGWPSGTPDIGVVTVSIAYEHPKGLLPGQVIDKYLREYSSSVSENPTWHIDWETKDLAKWADVLRTNKDDLRMLQAGAAYLTRYDRRSFGVLDALRKRDDAAAYSQALDGVVERMSQLVAERKAKAREAGQRGE